MGGLEKVQKSIGKKLSLDDYKTEIPQEVKTAKCEKVKVTVYLDKEAAHKLNEICSKKVLQTGKPDKSALISRAVDLLYKDMENV